MVIRNQRRDGVRDRRNRSRRKGPKAKVRREGSVPQTDLKLCQVLWCENIRVPGEKHVPGTFSCPDLFNAVLPLVTTSPMHLRAFNSTQDHLSISDLSSSKNHLTKCSTHGAGRAATKRYSESASLFLIRLSICLANKLYEVS